MSTRSNRYPPPPGASLAPNEYIGYHFRINVAYQAWMEFAIARISFCIVPQRPPQPTGNVLEFVVHLNSDIWLVMLLPNCFSRGFLLSSGATVNTSIAFLISGMRPGANRSWCIARFSSLRRIFFSLRITNGNCIHVVADSVITPRKWFPHRF